METKLVQMGISGKKEWGKREGDNTIYTFCCIITDIEYHFFLLKAIFWKLKSFKSKNISDILILKLGLQNFFESTIKSF